jgi:hypothetical protein
MALSINIQDLIKKEFQAGLPFMDGREKGSLVTEMEVHITDFGFLKEEETGEQYVAFNLKEDDNHFYFGGNIITEKMKTISNLLNDKQLEELQREGLKVIFIKRSSKNKRDYMDMEVQ